MPFQKGNTLNTNGRKRGSRNKRPELLAARKAEGGALPLDYLLSVMRDETKDVKERTEAAKAAAPYLHRKMPQAIEQSGTVRYEHRVISEDNQRFLEELAGRPVDGPSKVSLPN